MSAAILPAGQLFQSRCGCCEDCPDACGLIDDYPCIEVVGDFDHFCNDSPTGGSYTIIMSESHTEIPYGNGIIYQNCLWGSGMYDFIVPCAFDPKISTQVIYAPDWVPGVSRFIFRVTYSVLGFYEAIVWQGYREKCDGIIGEYLRIPTGTYPNAPASFTVSDCPP